MATIDEHLSYNENALYTENYMRKKTPILLILAVFTMINLSACQKESTEAIKLPPPENFEKLKRFVSITAGISESSLLYNESTQVFYLDGTDFKLTLKDVQTHYEVANIYKLDYEKN